MRVVRCSLFAALALAGSGLAQAQPVASDDRRAIERTIQMYFDGWAVGDSALLGRAMHESAHLKRSLQGKFVDMNRERYVGGMRLRAKNPTLATRIAYLDIVGPIAQARAEISVDTTTYVDYFNLLKTDDGWFIVDKVSTQIRRVASPGANPPTGTPLGGPLSPTRSPRER